MALIDLFRNRRESPVARRRRRKTEGGSALFRFLEHNRLVALAVFVLTVAAIFTISFVGVSPIAFRIVPHRMATIRIVADAEFTYHSKILTERARNRKANEVPPVFHVDHAKAAAFESHIRRLVDALNRLDPTWSSLSKEERRRELETIASQASAEGGF